MNATHALAIALLMASSHVMAQSQTDAYWLIGQAVGRWEYRVGSGSARQLNGKYDYLIPAGEVRCLETDLRRCELRYLTDPRSAATRRLPIQLQQSGKWVSLRGQTPPPPPVLSTNTSALAAKFKRFTTAGGSRAASGCGGEFPLRAPVCGENVDVGGFKIHWLAAPDRTGKVSLLVESVDGRPSVFRGTAAASSGEFDDARLIGFLRRIQARNDVVDIAVTIMADDGKKAQRLVHVPPSARTEEFDSRVKAIENSDPLLRSISVMSLALEEDMWSRAANEARRLMDLAPGSPSLLEYALAGLCQSDFEEERSQLRSLISEATYNRVCSGTSVASNEMPVAIATPNVGRTGGAPAPPNDGVPAAAVPGTGLAGTGASVASERSRLGVALLIGNWDYWNLPLNSVRSDLQIMKGELQTAGFLVTVRENLRGPQQFVTALEDTLKEQKATSDDLLFVYYSGHGLQLDGKAQLLGTGVSATPRVADDVRSNVQSAEGLLSQMERALPGTRVLVVEACRDSFFATSRSPDNQAARAGFAFQQDDVPNTFVMFANRPGLPAPARSSYGLMGPFTESFIYALHNSTGEILDVFSVAAKKTAEISPGQEPVLHHSKSVEPIVLKSTVEAARDDRARDLLNGAEALYRDHSWDEFLTAVDRGRALASSAELRQRLSREVEFATLVKQAENLERERKWSDAAVQWERAAELFLTRQWVTMKSAVAWLFVDDLPRAVRALGVLAAQPQGQTAQQAKQLLADLVKAFPALEADANKSAQEPGKRLGAEFELVKDQD